MGGSRPDAIARLWRHDHEITKRRSRSAGKEHEIPHGCWPPATDLRGSAEQRPYPQPLVAPSARNCRKRLLSLHLQPTHPEDTGPERPRPLQSAWLLQDKLGHPTRRLACVPRRKNPSKPLSNRQIPAKGRTGRGAPYSSCGFSGACPTVTVGRILTLVSSSARAARPSFRFATHASPDS